MLGGFDMPQPLSTLTPETLPGGGVKVVGFGQDALGDRPMLAAKVMRVIGICSFIDQQLYKIMANFIKADFEMVTAMMLALSGAEAKRAAMNAAALTALSEDDYCLYMAVLEATTPPRKQRNKYAHHLWGTANYIPDGLLLIDPQEFARSDAKYAAEHKAYRDDVVAYRAQQTRSTPRPTPPTPPTFDYTQIFVYRESDLERDVRDALKAVELISLMEIALSDHPAAAEMRSKLFVEPLFQRALEPKSTENGQ